MRGSSGFVPDVVFTYLQLKVQRYEFRVGVCVFAIRVNTLITRELNISAYVTT